MRRANVVWATIKAGRPWDGLVKNRAKNGDFYWVRANVTPQQAVKDAVELIGDRKVWLVLNQAEVHGAMGYYYGSQYGYRKGYGQPEQDAAQSS